MSSLLLGPPWPSGLGVSLYKILASLRLGSNPMRGSCQLLTEGCWFTPRNCLFLQLWQLTAISNQLRLKNGVKHQFNSIYTCIYVLLKRFVAWSVVTCPIRAIATPLSSVQRGRWVWPSLKFWWSLEIWLHVLWFWNNLSLFLFFISLSPIPYLHLSSYLFLCIIF